MFIWSCSGDPLRYHSHFVASVIASPTPPLQPVEIVAHGRLSTGAKNHISCAGGTKKIRMLRTTLLNGQALDEIKKLACHNVSHLGYQGLSSVVLSPIYGQYPTVHLCPFNWPPSILLVLLSCTITRNSIHPDSSTFLHLL